MVTTKLCLKLPRLRYSKLSDSILVYEPINPVPSSELQNRPSEAFQLRNQRLTPRKRMREQKVVGKSKRVIQIGHSLSTAAAVFLGGYTRI